ncbi:MAG: zinc ribbon domain-containing protein, partial [Nitrososphaerales archaeon]
MASKECPMCGTMNKERAQSCKYCGYLFENPSNQS